MKQVLYVLEAPAMHWVGDGFPVRSLFTYPRHGERLSPFLLLDHAGPTDFPPTDGRRGVGLHPHRGFETVTIVYAGSVAHRDTAGNAGSIGPGDVQWMTAGSGVLHEELHAPEFSREGGVMEMAQLWVNLPRASKMTAPRYQEIPRAVIPVVDLPAGAGSLRVIAGRFEDAAGPAATFTPLDVWDLRLKGDATLDVPTGRSVAVVLLDGAATVQGSHELEDDGVAVLGADGDRVAIAARGDAKLLVLHGDALGEPIVGSGPFVMSTEDEIRQAVADYHAGRIG